MAILSIQSHVVYGYAGNSSAVFPMQRLGNEVWAINTVEFSNHTGYGSWRGKVMGAELINELVTGLEERRVLKKCRAVLSGYLGDASVGKAIIEAVKKVKKENPAAIYACDPVMGDAGRGVYVKPDIPEIIKNKLIPHADIICPNQFELELLTGIKIDSEAPNKERHEFVLKAVNILHNMGPSIVLVTSFLDNAEQKENPTLSMLVSDRTGVFKITTPYLPLGDNVAGTGDLTASIFLARFLETRDTEKTLNLCTASVFGVLETSYKLCYNENKGAPIELKTIEAQKEIVLPSNTFKAVKFTV